MAKIHAVVNAQKPVTETQFENMCERCNALVDAFITDMGFDKE